MTNSSDSIVIAIAWQEDPDPQAIVIERLEAQA
jgi:hypothetical protein